MKENFENESDREIQKIIQDILQRPGAMEALKKVSEDTKHQKNRYQLRLESLKNFLSSINYIMPVDTRDFFDWYFTERVGFLPLPEAVAKEITDEDFKEYHLFRRRNFIDPASEKRKTTTTKKKKNKPQSLLEIWEKEEAHYNKVIEFLKEVSPTIGCSFIDNNLQWQKFNNHISYLAAFTWICIDKSYIKNQYSAPIYHRIYKNTFGIDFNSKPFQSIATKDFTGYIDVFANMP